MTNGHFLVFRQPCKLEDASSPGNARCLRQPSSRVSNFDSSADVFHAEKARGSFHVNSESCSFFTAAASASKAFAEHYIKTRLQLSNIFFELLWPFVCLGISKMRVASAKQACPRQKV